MAAKPTTRLTVQVCLVLVKHKEIVMKYSTLMESSPEQKTLFWPHELTTGGVVELFKMFMVSRE